MRKIKDLIFIFAIIIAFGIQATKLLATSSKSTVVQNGDNEEQIVTPDLVTGSYGIPTPGMSYAYAVKISTYATSLTLKGRGTSWLFIVDGGSAAFRINGGSSISLNDSGLGGDFKYSSSTPTINLDFIQSGSTATLFLEGLQ